MKNKLNGRDFITIRNANAVGVSPYMAVAFACSLNSYWGFILLQELAFIGGY